MATQWNLFAAELLAVLQQQDATNTLGALSKADIHPQKIQRLKESLELQGQFPVLNDQEFAQVVQVFDLADHELWLLAAILATGVEAKLLHRIGGRAALSAARALLPIIAQALADAENGGEGPLNQVRTGGTLIMSPLTQQFAEALARIDRGTLALYQAQTTAIEDRQEALRQARDDFTQALALLHDRADDAIRQDTSWLSWWDEAQDGLRAAQNAS